MRVLRGAERSYQLAARPTLTPSKWLMRFVKVDNEALYQLCIADAITTAGVPVLLTFTEVPTGADPLDAEVTLPPGQWQMYVYEQDSTTNLNWTLADRFVHEVMVEVVGAATADPEPTDPCDGVSACPYDGEIIVNGVNEGTFGPFDPCEDNTININITFS